LPGEEHADALVETYMIGAMNPAHARHYFQLTPNKAVVVGGDRTKIVLSALETPTVVIILTGSYVPDPALLERARERIQAWRRDPVLAVLLLHVSYLQRQRSK
jgi:BioD-like phosphotransacetylase family protein